MAQPNRYEPQAGFAEQTRNNVPGRSPINARALDDELSGISQSINGIVGNLELIQRDDGSLKDATVHLHALGESVLNLMGGFNLRGEWQANTSYAAKDIVDYQGHLFVCMTANQDAVFTAANWRRFGEKGAELHQVLRQVAHMQTQVQEEGRKALQAAAQTQQAAAQVSSQAGAVDASAQQAAASARAAKVSADAAEQSRIRAEAAAANAEGAVNNVNGKLATKLDTSVFNDFKGKAATKEELEEKVGNLKNQLGGENYRHQMFTASSTFTPPKAGVRLWVLEVDGGKSGGNGSGNWVSGNGGNAGDWRYYQVISTGAQVNVLVGASNSASSVSFSEPKQQMYVFAGVRGGMGGSRGTGGIGARPTSIPVVPILNCPVSIIPGGMGAALYSGEAGGGYGGHGLIIDGHNSVRAGNGLGVNQDRNYYAGDGVGGYGYGAGGGGGGGASSNSLIGRGGNGAGGCVLIWWREE